MGLLAIISDLGVVLMILSPVAALRFGWEVFFPVAITSIVGALICLFVRALAAEMVARCVAEDLVQDLVSADERRLELVLAELSGP